VPLRELMDDRLLDALLARSRDQAGGLRLTGEGSMLGELVKAVPARARDGLTAHLGYDRHGRERPAGAGNYRNGTIDKTVQTGVGPVPLAVLAHRAPVPPAVRHVPPADPRPGSQPGGRRRGQARAARS
jgi:hypothetical protein